MKLFIIQHYVISSILSSNNPVLCNLWNFQALLQSIVFKLADLVEPNGALLAMILVNL